MRGPAASGAFALIFVLGGCLGLGADVEPAGDPQRLDAATGFLFHNARVWTADADRPWASAVAVRADTIVGVGERSELEGLDLGDSPLVVDLDGRMVLPGLFDTHTHFLRVARDSDPADGNPYEPRLSPWDPVMGTVAQTQTALGHIGVWAQNNVDRVLAGGLPDPPHGHAHESGAHADPSHGLTQPIIDDLRQPASQERLLDGDDADVAAAAQAGLLGDTLRLSGRDSANDLGFGDGAAQAVPEDWLTMLRMGLATGARYGLTSHVEAGIGLDAFDVLERLERDGELSARFSLYVFPEELEDVIAKDWRTGHGDGKARLLGLKIYSDGWLGPRTAALSELYSDRPHRGFAFYTQDEVNEYVLAAHQHGLKLSAHTIGDRAAAMLLTAYENALAEGCPQPHATCEDTRFTLEHVQLVPPDLLDRMVAIGLVPSIQLSFAVSDSPWAESAIGAERLEQAYIWRTMLEAGLTLGGSSDFPIEVLPPLWGVQRMVTRADLDGSPAGGFQRHEAVELEQVLRMITIDAAYLTYQEDRLGSLTPGKLADLVVLETDLFAIPTDEIHETSVQLTMVDGRVVHHVPALALP